MFCENCGMEMEKAKFCPICGAEQTAVVTPAGSVPVSSPEAATSTPIASTPIASIPSAPSAPPNSFPAGVPNSPTVVITDQSKKRAPERKYTLGHILLCLVTAAIMAGVAGVFAGLYFSLLWSMQ